MPAKFTHIYIADQIFDYITENKLFKNNKINKKLLYLGAISHDLPYFHQSGKSDFSRIGKSLHGDNLNDPSIFLKKYKEKLTTDNQFSFLIGLITHYITDQVFHPVIYYQTGNYYDKDLLKREIAREKHRKLESLLDVFTINYFNFDYNIFNLKSVTKVELENLYTILSNSTMSKTSDWIDSFNDFLKIEKKLNNKNIIILLKLLSTFNLKYKSILALAIKDKKYNKNLFTKDFNYMNLYTGEKKETNYLKLFKTVNLQIKKILLELEEQNKLQLLNNSLSTFGKQLKPEDCKFFSNKS